MLVVFYSIYFILHISAEGTIDHTSYQGNNAVRKQFNFKFSLFSFFHDCALVAQNMKPMQANPVIKLYFHPNIKSDVSMALFQERRTEKYILSSVSVFIFSILGHKNRDILRAL